MQPTDRATVPVFIYDRKLSQNCGIFLTHALHQSCQFRQPKGIVSLREAASKLFDFNNIHVGYFALPNDRWPPAAAFDELRELM